MTIQCPQSATSKWSFQLPRRGLLGTQGDFTCPISALIVRVPLTVRSQTSSLSVYRMA
jgi:hypothetical protein